MTAPETPKVDEETPAVLALRAELDEIEADRDEVDNDRDAAQNEVRAAIARRTALDEELDTLNARRQRILNALNALGVTP